LLLAYNRLQVCGLPAEIPTMWGMAFGHGGVNATIPLGAVVVVDSARGVMELATPQVRASKN
jgi:muramoyltetrapeptide carboxypeptidase LdcA involved in peptidoglycan recycling